jgi:hypothetical protein
MISITVGPKVAHHALKVAWPVIAGGLILPTYHQPWWVKGLAMIPMFIGVFAALVAIVGHRPEECPLCTARPRERLNRVHYRLWRTYGRYGWALLALVALAWIVVTSFDEGLTKHDSQTLPAMVFWVGIVSMGGLYVMARRFASLNYGFTRPRPIRHFVQEHCAPLMHKSQNLIIAALVVNLVAMALVPRKGPWSLLGVTVSLALFAAVYLSLRHSASLCEICVDKAEIPIDAAEQAARNRWRFAMVHKSAPVLPLAMMATVIAPHWLSNMGDVALQAVFDVVLVASMLLANYHNAYQPWCPYCQGGGGGHDDELVPDPTPDNGRPLPVG